MGLDFYSSGSTVRDVSLRLIERCILRSPATSALAGRYRLFLIQICWHQSHFISSSQQVSSILSIIVIFNRTVNTCPIYCLVCTCLWDAWHSGPVHASEPRSLNVSRKQLLHMPRPLVWPMVEASFVLSLKLLSSIPLTDGRFSLSWDIQVSLSTYNVRHCAIVLSSCRDISIDLEFLSQVFQNGRSS